MDDFLNLSPIEQELEALTAIYLDELQVHRSENDQRVEEVELVLHPATGNDTTKQFVRMNLVFQPGCQYPDEVPEIVIRNPRGLGEEEMASLVEDMRKKAMESVGEVMLYTLIEMAKEALTEGNIPHSPCVVCLEHFQEHDTFHRTACYHYFHTLCLHKYLEHSRDQVERDRKEAEEHRHLNPEEEREEALIVCPVCRHPMDDDSLAVFCFEEEEEDVDNFIIPPNIREQQKKMAELYEKQKSKGAIIDLELERNKFLVNADERVSTAVTTTAENSTTEYLAKDHNRAEQSRNEPRYKSQVYDKLPGGAARKLGSSSDCLPKFQQRIRNDTHDNRRQDHYYNGRKDGRTDRGDRYDKGRDTRHREEGNRRMHRDGVNNKDRLSSDEGSVHSGVSEDVGSITFVNSKPARYNEGQGSQRDRGDGRGRGRRTDGGRREPNGRPGRGSGNGVRDETSHTKMAETSHSSQERQDYSSRDGSRMLGSDLGGVGRHRDSGRYDDDDVYEGNSESGRGRGSRRGQQRDSGSARGRGGFRREDDRRCDEENRSFDSRDSNSEYGSGRGQLRRDRGSGRGRGGFRREDDRICDEENRSFDSRDSKSEYGSGTGRGQLMGDRSSGRGRGGFRRGDDEENIDSRSFSSRGRSSEYTSGRDLPRGGSSRGRGGFRRGDERGYYDEDNRDAAASNSRSFNSGRGGNRNKFPNSRNDSERKRYNADQRDEDQQRRYEQGHNQQRNSRGGGRRNEFVRGDRDERRGQGYNDNSRRRDGRGGGGYRSDHRGSGRIDDEKDDEEEERRMTTDLKNLEINQRWRELNFQRQGGEQAQADGERKRRGFGVIDDDDKEDAGHYGIGNIGNGNYSEDDDVDIRHNPNYNNGNLVAQASSDSEEDWGKESDPFTFERGKIRQDQFEEYSRYKEEQLAHYAQKAEERAENQNSTRAEQRRIQREQQLKKEREQRKRLQEREQQTSSATQSLSVLDRFKLNQEKSPTEEDTESSKSDSHPNKNDNKPGQSSSSAVASAPRNINASGGSGGKASNDADFYRKKAGPLPVRNKAEGIKWVGVRDHEDIGGDLPVNEDVHSGGVFEDSWRRREEKERQRRKQQPEKRAKQKDKTERRDAGKGDEASVDSSAKETRVRSRRRDREKESQGLHKDFNTNIDSDIRFTQGDNVHKQSVVSSDGITQVSSRQANSVSSSQDNNCIHDDNPQHKNRKKKPLDLRKKTNHGSESDRQSQTSEPAVLGNLVGKFPSLQETLSKGLKKDVIQRSHESSMEDNGFLRMIPKNDNQVKDNATVTGLEVKDIISTITTHLDNNATHTKANNKPKPLDFRKGAKKKAN